MTIDPKHIIVGLSGGVDSSVAAYLLQQQGHQVTGLFMKNWEADDDDQYCTAKQDLEDAQKVCDQLGIELHTVNFAKTYWDKVFQHFLDEYAKGRTPNPDILCNQEIKFKAFLDYAMNMGADAIATGHYALISHSPINAKDNHALLFQAKDKNKDQSYFLHRLTQLQLSQSIFPLGEFTKPEVREIAKAQNFNNALKKDSTGICFIGERRFDSFLSEYLLAQPGPIKTLDGKIMGEHRGLMFHTIGQRKGLEIGGRQEYSGQAWYVADKDIHNNTLIIAQGCDHPALFKDRLTCEKVHWIGENPDESLKIEAKIRYRQTQQPCLMTQLTEDQYDVRFAQPQRAITPGQSIVFYHDELCLGGGIIV